MIMLQYSAFAEYLPTHRKPDDKFIVWTDDVAQAQSAQIALYDEETEQFVTPDTRRPIENVLLWAEVPTVGSLLFNLKKEET